MLAFIDSLIHLDQNLLLLINGAHNSFFDVFMFTYSKVVVWAVLYASVLYVLIKNKKTDALWLILALVLCIVIADQIASGIIKNAVQRLRPSRDPALDGLVHLVNGYKSGKYGFVSSHAANTIGFATLSSLIFRKRIYTIAIFFWAVLTCYSRMYLGVHYPLDILGGAIVGVAVAFFFYYLLLKLKPQSLKLDNAKQTEIPVYALGVTILCMLIYSGFSC